MRKKIKDQVSSKTTFLKALFTKDNSGKLVVRKDIKPALEKPLLMATSINHSPFQSTCSYYTHQNASWLSVLLINPEDKMWSIREMSPLASWTKCLSHKYCRSLWWTPDISVQAYTMMYRLFVSLTDRLLKGKVQMISTKDRRYTGYCHRQSTSIFENYLIQNALKYTVLSDPNKCPYQTPSD